MNKVADIRGPLGQKRAKQRYTALEDRHKAWMHLECRCCLSQRPVFDIAHTGGYAQGKGASRKAWLETCLPLDRALHEYEERNRPAFWASVGHPDYLAWAARLYDIFEKRDDPTALLLDMHETANLLVVSDMLQRKFKY